MLALADGFRDDGIPEQVYLVLSLMGLLALLPGAAIWLLCGTAPSHLESIGPLLLGRRNWHVAWRQSEWTGRASGGSFAGRRLRGQSGTVSAAFRGLPVLPGASAKNNYGTVCTHDLGGDFGLGCFWFPQVFFGTVRKALSLPWVGPHSASRACMDRVRSPPPCPGSYLYLHERGSYIL